MKATRHLCAALALVALLHAHLPAQIPDGPRNQFGMFVPVSPQQFVPLTEPRFVGAAEHKLPPDEPIVAVESKGDARAYPLRQIWYHHVVNDTVGGERLALFPQASLVAAFAYAS